MSFKRIIYQSYYCFNWHENDLEKSREVSKREAYKFAREKDVLFYEASAKTGKNINLIFLLIEKTIYDENYNSNKKGRQYLEEYLNGIKKQKQSKNQVNEEKNLQIVESFEKDNKQFFYKNTLFGFNFNSFIYHSNYFNENQNELEKYEIINLLFDEFGYEPNLSEDSICSFINFCKNHQVEINNLNVLEFYLLSTKFEVSLLHEKTENYLSIHWEEIISDFFNQRRNICLHEYEKIICIHLIDIITKYEDQLLKFPIHFIHRIISYYSIQNNKRLHFQIYQRK